MTRIQITRALLAAATLSVFTRLDAADPPKDVLQRAFAAAQAGDYPAAVAMLKTEAEKGSPDAANALGQLYQVGQGVKASATEAVRWYQQAADASFPPAMLNLGILLSKGVEGIPADPDKARFLIHAAAEEGYAPAQVACARMAEAGGEDHSDPAEARVWYEKAAAQENPEALVAMAHFYDEGIGGPRDPVKGFAACRRAADAGSLLAMNEIAVRYQKGLGVGADPIAAIGWFVVAAQRGQPAARVNLGNCYEVGKGVLQDMELAFSYYLAAAKQNFGPAQFLIAQLFEQGKGTKANPAQAYFHYSRAAANGIDGAARKADELKAKLTPEQLKEAAALMADAAKPAAPPAPPPKRK